MVTTDAWRSSQSPEVLLKHHRRRDGQLNKGGDLFQTSTVHALRSLLELFGRLYNHILVMLLFALSIAFRLAAWHASDAYTVALMFPTENRKSSGLSLGHMNEQFFLSFC